MKSPELDAARAATIAKLRAASVGARVTVRCDRHGPHGQHKGEFVGASENPYVWRIRFHDRIEENHHVDGIDL